MHSSVDDNLDNLTRGESFYAPGLAEDGPEEHHKSSFRIGLVPVKSALSFYSSDAPPSRRDSHQFDDIPFIESDEDGSDDEQPAPQADSFSSLHMTSGFATAEKSREDHLKPTPSFVQSMNEYMFRRKLVEDKVSSGELSTISDGSKHVDVRREANIDHFTDVAQLKRSTIKRDIAFMEEIQRIWHLVECGECLEKPSYMRMISKISLLIVPPPLVIAEILKTADQDWEKDLRWAREHGLVDGVAESLNYEAFFRSMFELIDTVCFLCCCNMPS